MLLSNTKVLTEECSSLTCEALVDVDAGRVIDHQAVQAWVDSRGRFAEFMLPSKIKNTLFKERSCKQ